MEFLGTDSINFNLIGAEGIGVLAHCPRTKLTEEDQTLGVQSLARHVERGWSSSASSSTLESVLQALRALFLQVGYVPRRHNQARFAELNGVVALMALVAESDSTLIQMETMHTLACVALGDLLMHPTCIIVTY